MNKVLLFTVIVGVIMTSCALIQPTKSDGSGQSAIAASPQFSQGKFHNAKTFDTMSLGQIPGYLKRFLFEPRKDAQPIKPVPVKPLTAAALEVLPTDRMTLFRLGHSSFLLKADHEYWLIDPVFSERASPFSFMGPKRFHQPPIDIDGLPQIRGVIISHNHYDHLDKQAIKQLKNKVESFIVPLGIGNDLINWGIEADNIVELDWWQSANIGALSLTSTPAQHFSGRGLTDGNETLWSSWVIKTPRQSLFYSGDTGYFDGFKTIGEQYGPFDMTIIETGAYDKNWPDVHMTPEQSLQAHIDVRGGRMLPAHNGTFDLAFHAWYEPLERITALGESAGVEVITPGVGEAVDLVEMQAFSAWWRGLN
ncbi:MAG: L-ascorbate metabolism protein UlaG (beta-lactamase superfamily) [Phenylobacterium sp.]|jgi:L-ascorbate metabolism protein UlaG (beta-lactamase superfamily)